MHCPSAALRALSPLSAERASHFFDHHGSSAPAILTIICAWYTAMVPRIFPRLFPFVIADAGIGIARRPFLGLIVAPPQTHVSTRPITACEASWYAVALRCALDLLALRRALDLLMATPCCSRMAAAPSRATPGWRRGPRSRTKTEVPEWRIEPTAPFGGRIALS